MGADNKPSYFGRDLEAMTFAVNYHRWIVREFEPYLRGFAAEVGAGTGNLTRLLQGRVNNLTAFEPSANMFPLLRESASGLDNVQPVNGYLGDAPAPSDGYDCLVYVNVLEHIEDDRQEVANMLAALRRGGHALIFVPALSWLFSELDRKLGHFRRYHRAPLQKLFTEAGFEIRRCRYFDVAGIIPWYLAFVLFGGTIRPRSVAIYDGAVVPVMRRVEAILPPPLGKNLLLVARKP